MTYDFASNVEQLTRPLDSLHGIQSSRFKLFQKIMKGDRIIDLLFMIPDSITDRTYRPSLQSLQSGKIATIRCIIHDVQMGTMRKRKRYARIRFLSSQHCLSVNLFAPWQVKLAAPGNDLCVSGKIISSDERDFVMRPLDYCVRGNQANKIPYLDPKWPLTAGLFHGQVQNAMRHALTCLPLFFPEWHRKDVMRQSQWPDFVSALRWVQTPDILYTDPQFQENWQHYYHLACTRLACDELLSEQISMRIAQLATRCKKGQAIEGNGDYRKEALEKFGFPLTQGQQEVSEEIFEDLSSPRRMNRLIQGDVGSGKTLIAILGMLKAAEDGYQSALMAPTEILAKQHLRACQKISPIPAILLCASLKAREKKEAYRKIASGEVKLVIGTQALIQSSVKFHKLGFVIIDEQHRFGVAQRLQLIDKGQDVNVLGMTATPIPRTLLLTRFGQMQTSFLKDKPRGRKAIQTSVHSIAQLGSVLEALRRILQKGAQIYWVCPLVSENDDLDIAAATQRYEELTKYFGPCVGLVHGHQDSSEQKEHINRFTQGKTSILVATTVIEVGVDVPSANVMIIEHAERFGLSQLHQLRGRVGRGELQSYCLLLYGNETGKIAKQRLACLRETEDGFKIANEDFRLRGSGDVVGYKQSGIKEYRFSKDGLDPHLLDIAHEEAQQYVTADNVDTAAHILRKLPQSIHILLRLFGQIGVSHIFDGG